MTEHIERNDDLTSSLIVAAVRFCRAPLIINELIFNAIIHGKFSKISICIDANAHIIQVRDDSIVITRNELMMMMKQGEKKESSQLSSLQLLSRICDMNIICHDEVNGSNGKDNSSSSSIKSYII